MSQTPIKASYPSITDLKRLYEDDDYLWFQETVKLLKNQQFDHLDLENLIEELEDLGSEKRHAIESYYIKLVEHLLIYQYWTAEREYKGNHWKREIRNFRYELENRLTPTLKNYIINNQDKLYIKGKKLAETYSGLELPSQCSYTLKQILDPEWLP